MTSKYSHILAKSASFGGTPLKEHLEHVAYAAERIATYLGVDVALARKGAILHDIGKASPVFQERLQPNYRMPIEGGTPFRHELASLLFLHLLPEEERPIIIDMVVAHHKSLRALGESKYQGKGLLDLDDRLDSKVFELHAAHWEEWMPVALGILEELGWKVRSISYEEACQTHEEVLDYVYDRVSQLGWSLWKGLLIGADHFASALSASTYVRGKSLFTEPDLSFYTRRQHPLYPLSLLSAAVNVPHTLVTAPTGGGKTDYLLRRCRGRVFYTLPFQASINAMYTRIAKDLEADNPNLDIRVLHASSRIIAKDDTEERDLQHLVGASIKVLTPYQMASIVFASKGFETTLIDVKGCDIILDEIHTYSSVNKAIVLKVIEVLAHFGCRLHIGTATMPSKLYASILELLGEDQVHQVHLDEKTLDTFDRHIVHKVQTWEEVQDPLKTALYQEEKVLIVCNRVAQAQALYKHYKEAHPTVPIMLIHSRFTRKDRKRLEHLLQEKFNTMQKACIVISTQVVEVSLDISFDIMFTEAAPLDALIQRFGRINRKRTKDTIGKYKPVYIVAPPEDKKEALPYDLDILQRSYAILESGTLFKEREAQAKIDEVYKDLDMKRLDSFAKFRDGLFELSALCHFPKSALLDTLNIKSVTCVTETDAVAYEAARGAYAGETRLDFEILIDYWRVQSLYQIDAGKRPFVIPDKAYDSELGVLVDLIEPSQYTHSNNFL